MKLIILFIISLFSIVMASSKYDDLYRLPRGKFSFPINTTETIDVKKEVLNYKVLLPYNETIRNYNSLYIAAHKIKSTDHSIEITFKANNISFSKLKGTFDRPKFYKIALPKIDSQTIEISPSSNLYIYQIYLVK